ncbi:hypothetical protein V6N11_018620 [Hibiscus sabdariffa]|uniref:Uncharacterized protein n=1 Tax=Hibiscus sabdariffa TaxID=183260 RepID=A0ABR2N8E8_9ROSI
MVDEDMSDFGNWNVATSGEVSGDTMPSSKGSEKISYASMAAKDPIGSGKFPLGSKCWNDVVKTSSEQKDQAMSNRGVTWHRNKLGRVSFQGSEGMMEINIVVAKDGMEHVGENSNQVVRSKGLKEPVRARDKFAHLTQPKVVKKTAYMAFNPNKKSKGNNQSNSKVKVVPIVASIEVEVTQRNVMWGSDKHKTITITESNPSKVVSVGGNVGRTLNERICREILVKKPLEVKSSAQPTLLRLDNRVKLPVMEVPLEATGSGCRIDVID